jgi:hypothetical protein
VVPPVGAGLVGTFSFVDPFDDFLHPQHSAMATKDNASNAFLIFSTLSLVLVLIEPKIDGAGKRKGVKFKLYRGEILTILPELFVMANYDGL